jgi:hypothetical protein
MEATRFSPSLRQPELRRRTASGLLIPHPLIRDSIAADVLAIAASE